MLIMVSCQKETPKLFTLTKSGDTGLAFINQLEYTEEFNTYTYRNFYNGGGVAIGDINNDGLADIYFTGNMVDNKMYLNKGNWKFEDITQSAGVACPGVWSTGVSMVDINGDGLLDIYVCKAGPPGGPNRHNELFINNGDLTFTESSKVYGLDITGLSIHAAFFDYDRDGDLDCYILSNSLRSVGGFDLLKDQRNTPDPEGNKLLRNDNGYFRDVSQEAGIYSSKIGYGLGVTLSDFNLDGWPDIFISNDFFEKDYLYLNNQDGTFKEVSEEAFTSQSMGSMGADAADLNNDLWPDLFVTEMLPRDHQRKKTKNIYESWDKYSTAVTHGYFHQYSRNALHRNIGNGRFLEISRFAGVADTDWSWASLAQDYDNDGWKDLFVSNGIFKDLLDRDYLSYSANATMIRTKIENKEKVLTTLVDSMPSVPVKNCIFRNKGNFTFEYMSDIWGMEQLTFSNGSAYGDLDNDGDLDLVVNNVNMPAFVYRNNQNLKDNKSIRFLLKGEGINTQAIGSRVVVHYMGQSAMAELFPSRGFQSGVEPVVHFGVGKAMKADSVEVYWPDGRYSILKNPETGNLHILSQKDSKERKWPQVVLEKVMDCRNDVLDFVHKDTDVNLFTLERLLPEMAGFTGPALAVADVNGDGMDDIFIGGGRNQSSVLYISISSDKWKAVYQPFEADYRSECVKAVFFDSDSDGDMDLYVANGGKTFSEFAPELHDILYINDGKGNYTKSPALPFPSGICTGDIAIADLDKNGLSDIVVCEHMKTGTYGLPGSVYILYNEGNNRFRTATPDGLGKLGMITSVVTMDVNEDGYEDLVMAGKWMPVLIAMNSSKGFQNGVREAFPGSSGLWNCIYKSDADGDGRDELYCGNEGENSFFRPGMRMYIQDFDDNGTLEQLICFKKDGKEYAVQDPDDMYSQMPVIKKRFRKYSDLAAADIHQMFDAQKLNTARILSLDRVQSVMLTREKENFRVMPLPPEIQYSSVHAFHFMEKRGGSYILAGGNFYQVKPVFSRQDASCMWKMDVKKSGTSINFGTPKPLYVYGQIRNIHSYNNRLVIGMNGGPAFICNPDQ